MLQFLIGILVGVLVSFTGFTVLLGIMNPYVWAVIAIIVIVVSVAVCKRYRKRKTDEYWAKIRGTYKNGRK